MTLHKNWCEAIYDFLLHVEDEQTLFLRIVAAGKELGFEYCSYGIKIPVPISRPRVAIFDNYPNGWMERYRDQSYLDLDPTVRHGASSNLPIIWTEDVFTSTLDLWDDCRAIGLNVGWAQSSRDASGAFGLLSLARGTEPLTENEVRTRGFHMFLLSQMAHAGMSKLLIPKLVPEAATELTSRELEVLCWTAEGKTSYEIGQILKISERTVNFHANNAIQKLDCTNKVQATIKAVTLGLLFTSRSGPKH